MQVRRRLIIYVEGYDPRGLPEYYRLFRREYRKTCELYGLNGDIGRVQDAGDAHDASWNAVTSGNGWTVDTHYLFLRWEDVIRKDFVRPAWLKIIHMFRAMARSIVNGVVPRCFMAHWRFGLFIIYPMMLMLAWMALGAAVGILCGKLFAAVGAPPLVSFVVGAAAALGAFAFAVRRTEAQTYLLYMCDDIDATERFARGRRPDWEERMELFAGYLIEAVRSSEADEAIVVGHSSGSFLAVDVLDRALARDPALGRHKPRLRLLTIGANMPIIGFNPRAQWFRDRLRRLALAPDVDWVDYQSRHDIMNFWPFDPVAGLGIRLGAKRRNPLVVAISFRDLWIPADFGRRRWRFFEAHFQFLLANERRGAAYDYYLICCGPLDLLTRARHPETAIASMTAGQDRHT